MGHGSHIQFSRKVKLPAGQSKKVTFTPKKYNQLSVDHPNLWRTHTFGKSNLYHLHLQYVAGHKFSDQQSTQFCIRTVSNYIIKNGFRDFRLNGKKILIKGGGWTDPMLLNASKAYERACINYAVPMNLDAIQMEDFWGENHHLYNPADKKGALVQVGINCIWEDTGFNKTTTGKHSGILPTQIPIAAQSFKDEIT